MPMYFSFSPSFGSSGDRPPALCDSAVPEALAGPADCERVSVGVCPAPDSLNDSKCELHQQNFGMVASLSFTFRHQQARAYDWETREGHALGSGGHDRTISGGNR